ncbi:bifunctional DNA primase/polymerase [Bradyrhizobium sp. Pha-3]|uniref:bifunctional DNA primase/polymerase n=1 Tax=Bradyrhizobium sp. Pha-3 TaxID=208375 RepID=UPI0035D43F2A
MIDASSISVQSTALAFARHGHAVLPLTWPIRVNGRAVCSCRKAADCISGAKHPLGRLVPNGLLSASTDPAVIRRWFADEPQANLGVVTNRLVVLDVDPRHDGDSSLAALEHAHNFPPTWRVMTGGGGEHVIFKCPEGVEIASSQARDNPLLGPGIDIRARDGYIVAPPSRHLTANRYAWSVDHHPAEIPLAELPVWLAKRLASPPRQIDPPRLPQPYQNWLKLTREPVTEYADLACARFGGYLVRHLDPAVALDVLFWWNEHVCRPPLEASEVHRIWRRIVHRHAERIMAKEAHDA